jgi:polyferredoxin
MSTHDLSPKNRIRSTLHQERLATTDAHGHRVYVHPEDVKGKWKNRRNVVYWFLIAIYMSVPWIHWNGKQIILFNLPDREFTFFGTTFYGHDAPLVFFVLVGFVLAFAFITSQWGRVWCGWACPQTVFIDAIYRKIEQLVEGKARARKNLEKAAWSFQKVFKKSLKWFLFLIVSLHISHTFLGYFMGARELFFITLSPPAEHILWSLSISLYGRKLSCCRL